MGAGGFRSVYSGGSLSLSFHGYVVRRRYNAISSERKSRCRFMLPLMV